jgi:hypothetical protein
MLLMLLLLVVDGAVIVALVLKEDRSEPEGMCLLLKGGLFQGQMLVSWIAE